MLTIICQLVDERFGNVAVLARVLDVPRDPGEIAPRARKIGQTRHLERWPGLVPLFKLLTRILAHIFTRMAAALGNRGIERRPQIIRPEETNGMANGILWRPKCASGEFRLDPLSGIRCQFDFHRRPRFVDRQILPRRQAQNQNTVISPRRLIRGAEAWSKPHPLSRQNRHHIFAAGPTRV
jgi:hypothetical protein